MSDIPVYCCINNYNKPYTTSYIYLLIRSDGLLCRDVSRSADGAERPILFLRLYYTGSGFVLVHMIHRVYYKQMFGELQSEVGSRTRGASRKRVY